MSLATDTLLDYATIRAQRIASADVCSSPGCTEPIVVKYGREVFNGAGIEFVVTKRFCARHHAAYRSAVAQDGQIVQERCG